MIITRIQYIFFLLLISTFLNAKNVDLTFEIFNAERNYMDIAREKAYKLNEKGFNCYILRGKSNISLRCNDSKTTQEMQKNINLFNKEDIKYTIINRGLSTDKIKTKHYISQNELYLGYRAYNHKDYKRALEIFQYNYNKKNNFKHAYAYALALMKFNRYDEALNVLKPYKRKPKAKKLYDDITLSYFYGELHKKNYAKAKILAKKYNLKSKIFDIDYTNALDLVKEKKYNEANVILKPYLQTHSKANKLFIDNIIAIASKPYKQKDYKQALSILEPYKDNSKKIQNFYDDIRYNRLLNTGWLFVDTNPTSALRAFKKSCSIKKRYGCYSGMMYSYYNLKEYETSLYLAKKLYLSNPSDELSTMAMRSSLKLEKYDDAKIWYNRIKNKNDITNPYLNEVFLKIDSYIKEENYTQAQDNIDYLKKLYPNDNKVLTKEMQLYMAQKRYDKAQEIAREILKTDRNSSDARYVLAIFEFENHNYATCSSILRGTKLTQTYQKDMLYKCDAYDAVSNKDMKKAIKSIDKIQNDEVRFVFYLDVGDMFTSIDDPHAIESYKQAKKYKQNDIDIEMVYLYSLKKFTRYKELDNELVFAFKNFPSEEHKLTKFQNAYEKERLYGYYKNEKYQECYEYSEKIDNKIRTREIYRLGAWCAYSAKKYNKAKEKFAKANLLFGDDSKDIYAYALTTYKLGEYERATQALDRISDVDDEKQKLLIANLYTDLQKQQKAKKVLKTLDDSSQRDEAFVNLNKSHTKLFYENSASVGMFYQSQVGRNAKNKFDKYVVPIDYDYYDRDNDLHLYFDGDLMYLYNGSLGSNTNDYLDYGFGTSTQSDAVSDDAGFMPKIGIDYKNIRAMIGTTPIGAKISPELTWLLSGYITGGNWLGSLKVEQKEVDETMLSFVGETAKDGNREKDWGRVVKRGGELGISYDSLINLSLNLAYYPEIFGENVEDNSEAKATLVAIYYPEVEDISYLQVGAIGIYDSYDKNSNLFTYGHGGYFSPQEFFLGGIFAQLGDIINKDFYYQARLALGFETYSVDSAKKFPLKDGVVNSDAVEPGYKDNGLDYQVALQAGYQIDKHFDFISGISFEHFNDYSIQQVSFALLYRFNKRLYTPFNSFYLNHRVDQIIPRYEVAK